MEILKQVTVGDVQVASSVGFGSSDNREVNPAVEPCGFAFVRVSSLKIVL